MFARAVGAVALVCVALSVGGCNESAKPTWSTPAVASASPTATATASPPLTRSALQAKAKAATIAPKGLTGIGVSTRPKTDKSVSYDITRACGKRIDADQNTIHAAYNRTWSAQGWWVNNTVHGYGTAAGTDVVNQLRAAVESCKTYPGSEGEVTLLGAMKVPRHSGVEASYGYCQKVKRTDATYVSCLAFLAKDNLVSSVWVVHGSTQKTNSTGLTLVSAIAAKALLKAA